MIIWYFHTVRGESGTAGTCPVGREVGYGRQVPVGQDKNMAYGMVTLACLLYDTFSQQFSFLISTSESEILSPPLSWARGRGCCSVLLCFTLPTYLPTLPA